MLPRLTENEGYVVFTLLHYRIFLNGR